MGNPSKKILPGKDGKISGKEETSREYFINRGIDPEEGLKNIGVLIEDLKEEFRTSKKKGFNEEVKKELLLMEQSQAYTARASTGAYFRNKKMGAKEDEEIMGRDAAKLEIIQKIADTRRKEETRRKRAIQK